MIRSTCLLALLALAACGPSESSQSAGNSARNPKSYPVLPDADSTSPVKIKAIEGLCARVDAGTAMAQTAIAFKGQRLQWTMTVESVQGRRLIAGAGTVRVSAITDDAEDCEAEEEVEVDGIITALDPGLRMVTLDSEASVSPAR